MLTDEQKRLNQDYERRKRKRQVFIPGEKDIAFNAPLAIRARNLSNAGKPTYEKLIRTEGEPFCIISDQQRLIVGNTGVLNTKMFDCASHAATNSWTANVGEDRNDKKIERAAVADENWGALAEVSDSEWRETDEK